jgi:hypothetical protein
VKHAIESGGDNAALPRIDHDADYLGVVMR